MKPHFMRSFRTINVKMEKSSELKLHPKWILFPKADRKESLQPNWRIAWTKLNFIEKISKIEFFNAEPNKSTDSWKWRISFSKKECNFYHTLHFQSSFFLFLHFSFYLLVHFVFSFWNHKNMSVKKRLYSNSFTSKEFLFSVIPKWIRIWKTFMVLVLIHIWN